MRRTIQSYTTVVQRAVPAAEGQRTLVAQPNCSNRRINQADGSTMPRPAPWRVQVGWGWWTLWQLSPRGMTESDHRLVLRSLVPAVRRPKVWHNELTDQVMWCRSAIRTSPAQ